MMMDALKPGDVVRYHYLWAPPPPLVGRLDPSASLSERPSSQRGFSFSLYVAKAGYGSRLHLAVSEMECRCGGLDLRSWLVLDEYNRVSVGAAYDFETPTAPIGTFSPAFIRKIASVIKQAAARRRLRGIARK